MFGKRKDAKAPNRPLQLSENLKGRLASSVDFTVLDCEMTGLDLVKHEIISIGAVKIRRGEIDLSQSFYRVLRPRRLEMSKENVLIHGLNHDTVAAGEDPELVLDDLVDFIQDTILVGHFVAIDLGFLNILFARGNRRRPEQPILDTRSLQEWYLDNAARGRQTAGLQLCAIAKQFNLPSFQAHHAYYDALTTACLFLKQLSIMAKAGIYTLEDIYNIGRETGV